MDIEVRRIPELTGRQGGRVSAPHANPTQTHTVFTVSYQNPIHEVYLRAPLQQYPGHY
jgi:hypothetical protein